MCHPSVLCLSVIFSLSMCLFVYCSTSLCVLMLVCSSMLVCVKSVRIAGRKLIGEIEETNFETQNVEDSSCFVVDIKTRMKIN